MELFRNYPGGVQSEYGQKLNKINLPEITTIIAKKEEDASLSIEATISQSNLTNINVESQVPIGITIDTFSQEVQTVAPVTEIVGATIGEKIPTTIQEAYENIGKISVYKSGKNRNNYNVNQIRAIARNLSLATTGSKAEVAQRILDAISNFYKLKQ